MEQNMLNRNSKEVMMTPPQPSVHGEDSEIKEKMSDSRKLAVLAALFVIFGCVASDSHRRMDKVITRCCKSVSSMIPKKIRDEIISYTHQNALDPCVHAIIFQTKNNGKVCTDPNARWVPKKLKELQKQS
ncbi:C-C motif chemokine 8-like isoform X3 [Anguilla rostrata]|uniref:C-C motif chemokine 8-like isoform X3 n=1 Tax=Anguilla rostrata TaxID=7938 RepID=UPI0030D58ED4